MKLDNTPLRNLVKAFAGGAIDREEYVRIRARLLQKLEDQGQVTENDLKKLLQEVPEDGPTAPGDRYSRMDWLLILLGLGAALGLALILYN